MPKKRTCGKTNLRDWGSRRETVRCVQRGTRPRGRFGHQTWVDLARDLPEMWHPQLLFKWHQADWIPLQISSERTL